MERVAVWVVAAPVGALFAMAGVGHFTKYDAFLGIMKGMPFPAAHPAAVYVSGVVEFVCGTGLVLAPLVAGPAAASKVASALFCLVVAVTPANINSYMNDIPFGKSHLSYGWTGGHVKRAVAQIVLLGWLYGVAQWYASIDSSAKSKQG
eukprot:m.106136 g.106136  ORF g.106136 m.106136 type:complete len:149 (+) comp21065_c0_seq1:1175-1621(+)